MEWNVEWFCVHTPGTVNLAFSFNRVSDNFWTAADYWEQVGKKRENGLKVGKCNLIYETLDVYVQQ